MTRRWSGRYVLVVAQIAMGLVLTFGAALLVRTLQNLQHVDGGFNTGNVLVFALDARDTRFPPSVVSLCGDVLDRVRSRAGVLSASCSTMSPIDTAMEGRVIGIPTPPPGAGASDVVFANTVTPEYFETFGIQLVRAALHHAGPIDVDAGGDRQRNRCTHLLRRCRSRRPSTRLGPQAESQPGIDGRRRSERRTSFAQESPPAMVYQPLEQILEPPLNLTAAVRHLAIRPRHWCRSC